MLVSQLTRQQKLTKNSASLRKAKNFNSFTCKSDRTCLLPLFTLEFGLSLTCLSLLNAITTTVISCVLLPCCIQNILTPCSPPLALVIELDMSRLPQSSLSFIRMWYETDVQFRALIFCMLPSCLCLYKSHLLHKAPSQVKVERCIEDSNKSLRVF